jgi:hypothetical protein
MALNPFIINKSTSKPWSNLVKFSRFYALKRPFLTPNGPFSTPKRMHFRALRNLGSASECNDPHAPVSWICKS